MKFLETIQKRESEFPIQPEELVENGEAVNPSGDNVPPSVLAVPDLRIGAPRGSMPHSPDTTPTGVRSNGNGKPRSLVPIDPGSLGELPHVGCVSVNIEQVNPRLVAVTQPRSPYCEEYRNLRTQILNRSKKRKLQAIVVASVGPSEGKSVTAANLSWLFAQADGVRALIIDADLRRPSLGEYLGIRTHSGLSDVLAGTTSLTDAMVRLEPAGLFVLPGGEARSDVAELISGPRFSEILKEARSYFDYVIIDAPPLGIFTDASLLINQTDGALLVIRANHTKYKDVDRILESLPRERMLGIILNQSEVPLMDESYYKYGLYDRNEPLRA